MPQYIIEAIHDMLKTLREVRDHLYTKQDIDRVRDMARAALDRAEGRDA